MVDIFARLEKNAGGPIGQYMSYAHGYYAFPKLEGDIGPHMTFRGKKMLNWSLNNYLGLANHPEVRKADAEGAAQFGMGSMMKIVACALAVSMLGGLDIPAGTFAGFILLLGVTMIAAPGVPGGAIMAALGLLESMLGFDETLAGLMIATYIAMDSFGTATNVTGDGAVAVIVDAIDRRSKK